MLIRLELILIALMTALTAVIPGVFLVLRGVSLMSDAISHAIVLGIVVMFLWVQRLDSSLLMLGASLAGIITVIATELLIKTERIKKDAAIGLIFPLFFSLGIILISRYACTVHIDTDVVLLGEIAFAPLNRISLYSIDCGPYALWVMITVFLINLFFLLCFYKELKLAIFDPEYAYLIGFSPTWIYYGLMMLTSITTVVAFDIVGSIVIIALMITPPATAYLLTYRLLPMISISMVVSIIAVIFGYGIAWIADVSIAGSIATMSGIIFIIVLILAPSKGIMRSYYLNRRIQKQMMHQVLCTYLYHARYNCNVDSITLHLNWSLSLVHKSVQEVVQQGFVADDTQSLTLTAKGRAYVYEVMYHIQKGH